MIRALGVPLALACVAGCAMSNKPPAPAVAMDDASAPARVGVEGASLDVRLTRDERGLSLVLNQPADVVWPVVSSVYEELDLEPDLIDARRRRYGSVATGLRVAGLPMGDVARCGSQATGLATTTRMSVRLTIVTTVTPMNDGRSVLTTRVTGQGSRIDGTSTGGSDCVSTGTLEERIAGRVRLEAGG